MSYFYYVSNGPNQNLVLSGLGWLNVQCNSGGRSGVIAIPQKNNLQVIFGNILPSELISELGRNNRLSLQDQIFYLLTIRQAGVGNHHRGPIFVIYPNIQLLNIIDTYQQTTDILVLPWNMNEVGNWLNYHNATVMQ